MGVAPPARGGLRVAGDRYDHRLAQRRADGGAPPEFIASGRVMLYHLLEPLFDTTPFSLFQYLTFRAVAAMLTALFMSLALGPRVIRWLRRQIGRASCRERVKLSGVAFCA